MLSVWSTSYGFCAMYAESSLHFWKKSKCWKQNLCCSYSHHIYSNFIQINLPHAPRYTSLGWNYSHSTLHIADRVWSLNTSNFFYFPEHLPHKNSVFHIRIFLHLPIHFRNHTATTVFLVATRMTFDDIKHKHNLQRHYKYYNMHHWSRNRVSCYYTICSAIETLNKGDFPRVHISSWLWLFAMTHHFICSLFGIWNVMAFVIFCSEVTQMTFLKKFYSSRYISSIQAYDFCSLKNAKRRVLFLFSLSYFS